MTPAASDNDSRAKHTGKSRLVFTGGPQAGQVYSMVSESAFIGRGALNDIVITDDNQVSREHARLQVEDEALVLYDLESSNGTFINGERVQRQVLRDGDRVQLGKTVIEYLAGSGPAPESGLDQAVERDSAPAVPEREATEAIGRTVTPGVAEGWQVKAFDLLEKAEQLEQAGQPAEALDVYGELIGLLPPDSPLFQEVVLLKTQLAARLEGGSRQPAEEFGHRAAGVDAASEEEAEIRKMVAEAEQLEQQHRTADALVLYQEILNRVPESSPLHQEVRLILSAQAVRQAGGDEAALLVARGQRLEDQGDAAGALAAYQEALAQAPPGGALWKELDLIVQSLEGRSQEHMAEQDGVIRRAEALETQGRWAEAAEIYREQLARAPDSNRAGEWQAYLAHCQEEMMLEALFDQGLAAAQRNDWAQAHQALSRVVQRRPGYERHGQQAAIWLQAAEKGLSPPQKTRSPLWSLAGGAVAILIFVILAAGGFSAFKIIENNRLAATREAIARREAADADRTATAQIAAQSTATAGQAATTQAQQTAEPALQATDQMESPFSPVQPGQPHTFLLYEDGFSDPTTGWQRAEDADQDLDYQDGEYVIRNKQGPHLSRAIAGNSTFSNFTLEVDVRLIEGADLSSFGLVFRHQDEENYYRFEIDTVSRYRIGKVEAGELVPLSNEAWIGSSNIQTEGRINAMRVVCSGPMCSTYINGQHLETFEVNEVAAGTVGLLVETTEGSAPVGVAFDDLRVYVAGEEAPAVEPILPEGSTAYFEDFDDPESGWPRTEDDRQSGNYENGLYILVAKQENRPAWAHGRDDEYTDVIVEANTRFLEGPANTRTGLGFRQLDDENYHVFYVTGEGRYGLVKVQDGKIIAITEEAESPHILSGQAGNSLKLASAGDTVSLYANEHFLRSVRFESPVKGRVGLYAEAPAGSAPVKVTFDDIRVSGPGESGTQDSAASPEPEAQPPLSTGTAPPPTTGTSTLNKIAFVSRRDGNDEIYIMNAGGSNRTRLTDNPAYDSHPAWSPDGTRIAFVSDRDGNPEIYVMNADGSQQSRLTNEPSADFSPAWSPDGTRITFESDRESSVMTDIWVMNADGSNAVKLQEAGREPSWAPDGTRIAAAFQFPGSMNIGVVPVDGSSGPQPLLQLGINSCPDWSPDGDQIVFQNLEGDHTEILSINSDGSNLVKITRTLEMNDWHPSWSPDGNQIVFAREREGNTDIYVTGLNGETATRLTEDLAWEGYPDWSP